VTGRQRDQPRGHHRRRAELRQRRADAGAEHPEQVVDQVVAILRLDGVSDGGADPRRHAVHRLAALERARDGRVLGVKPGAVLRLGREHGTRVAAREGQQVLEGLWSRTDLERREAHGA
jgi:hypothetical protein